MRGYTVACLCAGLWFLLATIQPLLRPAHAHGLGSHAADLQQIVRLVNRERTKRELPPLAHDPLLATEAQRFSAVQARLGYLSHRGDDRTNAGQRLAKAGYRWRGWAENLAAGQESAAAVVAAWMASPLHRANLLHPRMDEIGIGHTYWARDPSRYHNYWVLLLGRER